MAQSAEVGDAFRHGRFSRGQARPGQGPAMYLERAAKANGERRLSPYDFCSGRD
jgi:hypothetical protein